MYISHLEPVRLAHILRQDCFACMAGTVHLYRRAASLSEKSSIPYRLNMQIGHLMNVIQFEVRVLGKLPILRPIQRIYRHLFICVYIVY